LGRSFSGATFQLLEKFGTYNRRIGLLSQTEVTEQPRDRKRGRGLTAVDNTNLCSGAFEVLLSGVQWRSDATLCSGSPRRLGPSIDLTCLAAGLVGSVFVCGGIHVAMWGKRESKNTSLNLHVHSVPWLSPQAPPGHRSPPTATIHRTVHVCIISVFLSGPRASSRHRGLPLFHSVSTSGVCARCSAMCLARFLFGA
jgi:hypothetical protein